VTGERRCVKKRHDVQSRSAHTKGRNELIHNPTRRVRESVLGFLAVQRLFPCVLRLAVQQDVLSTVTVSFNSQTPTNNVNNPLGAFNPILTQRAMIRMATAVQRGRALTANVCTQTSSEADDDSPPPIGTFDAMAASNPGTCRSSCASTPLT
jgi:hypothetical protein